MPSETLRRQTIVIIASDTQQAPGAMDAHRNSNTSFCRLEACDISTLIGGLVTNLEALLGLVPEILDGQ